MTGKKRPTPAQNIPVRSRGRPPKMVVKIDDSPENVAKAMFGIPSDKRPPKEKKILIGSSARSPERVRGEFPDSFRFTQFRSSFERSVFDGRIGGGRGPLPWQSDSLRGWAADRLILVYLCSP